LKVVGSEQIALSSAFFVIQHYYFGLLPNFYTSGIWQLHVSSEAFKVIRITRVASWRSQFS